MTNDQNLLQGAPFYNALIVKWISSEWHGSGTNHERHRSSTAKDFASTGSRLCGQRRFAEDQEISKITAMDVPNHFTPIGGNVLAKAVDQHNVAVYLVHLRVQNPPPVLRHG